MYTVYSTFIVIRYKFLNNDFEDLSGMTLTMFTLNIVNYIPFCKYHPVGFNTGPDIGIFFCCRSKFTLKICI